MYAALLDLLRQVANVLQPGHGGTGSRYGEGRTVVKALNSTGADLEVGSLVQPTFGANDLRVAKVASANSKTVLGVVVGYYAGDGQLIEEDAPDGFEVAVQTAGVASVLIDSTVTRADYAFSSTTAGKMVSSSSAGVGAFGVVVDSADTGAGATTARVFMPVTGSVGGGVGSGFASPAFTFDSSAAAGAATTLVRSDAQIALFDATAPSTQAIGDSASVGTAGKAARRDHKHGMPAFATNTIALGSSAAAGSAATLVRSDATIAAFDGTNPAAIGTAATGSAAFAARRDHVHATGAGTPTTQAFGDTATTGSGPAAAMSDHKHGMPSDPTGGTGTTTVTKASDERIASSTTIQDDDELFFSTVSGKQYVFDCDLIIDMDSNSASVDIKFEFGEDSTFRGWYYALAPLSGGGAFTLGSVQTGQTRTFDTGAFPYVYRVMGSFTAGGGTFRFRWAQNASNSIGIIVKAGSQLRYRRLT